MGWATNCKVESGVRDRDKNYNYIAYYCARLKNELIKHDACNVHGACCSQKIVSLLPLDTCVVSIIFNPFIFDGLGRAGL